MKNLYYYLLVLLISANVFSADVPNQIKLTIKDEDAKNLHIDTGKKIEFLDATIAINGQDPVATKLRTRGQSCLDSERKCFSVKMSEKQAINGLKKPIKKFNLASLWEDDGYISSIIGYTFYSEFGLYPFKRTLTEVVINDKSYGLYLLIEKPKRYFKKKLKSPFVARRKYQSVFETKDYKEELTPESEEYFLEQLTFLEKNPDDLEGKELYDHLNERMNFNQYMRWNVLNSLTKNGDFTDEVWFVAREKDGLQIPYFEIFAWDFESLFTKPHIGFQNSIRYRRWLKKSVVYSFESELEIVLYKDKFIYEKFKETMRHLLSTKITNEFIDQKMDEVKKQITPYAANKRVLAPSVKDKGRTEPYTSSYILNLLEKRRKFLKERRRELLDKSFGIKK